MDDAPRKAPPKKKPCQGRGPRRFNGAVLGVREIADFHGTTEGTIRSWVERQLIPYHKIGGRILFVRAEVETFLCNLPGCSVREALANVAARTGGEQ